MDANIKFGEIVYCNLKFRHKKKTHEVKNVVYKHLDGFYNRRRVLDEFKIKEPVKVLKIEIHERLGFENKTIDIDTTS